MKKNVELVTAIIDLFRLKKETILLDKEADCLIEESITIEMLHALDYDKEVRTLIISRAKEIKDRMLFLKESMEKAQRENTAYDEYLPNDKLDDMLKDLKIRQN